MPRRNLRLELFSIHAHLDNNQPVDYVQLFRSMTALQGYHFEQGNRQVAIGRAAFSDDRLFLVAYTGYSEKNLMFFDVTQQIELNEATPAGRFQARKTHAMIDPNKRLLLIETKKGNLSPGDLATIIEANAQRIIPGYESLELAFTPRPDASFIAQIDRLARIQSATVTLSRPNIDWTDQYNRLTDVADESNAKAIDVSVRAKRGKSLTRDAGLIGFVKEFAGHPVSIFKRIVIYGERGQESGLIQLNLDKHVEHLNITVETNPATGQVNDNEVREHMQGYIESKE